MSGELLRAMMRARAVDVQGRLRASAARLFVRCDGRRGQRFEIGFPFVAREPPLRVR